MSITALILIVPQENHLPSVSVSGLSSTHVVRTYGCVCVWRMMALMVY